MAEDHLEHLKCAILMLIGRRKHTYVSSKIV